MPCSILPPTKTTLEVSRETLRGGNLVVIPTETVYGLAANAYEDTAVAKIYALKKRPAFNPLIIHYGSLTEIEKSAFLTPTALQLAEAFWPGPLTLVLRRRPTCPVSLLASAGLETLAVRIPAHPLTQKLLHHTGFPLAAPSANPSEGISPTSPADVVQAFQEYEGNLPILEGGPCKVGLESTIVDLTEQNTPRLLRPGFITPENLRSILGVSVLETDENFPIKAPGQLRRHYAPSLPLRLNVTEVGPTEALLSFGPHTLTGSKTELNLSPTGNLEEAAANFFRFLRLLDSPVYSRIAVLPVPDTSIGLAINDRLRRAATLKES